MSVFIEQIFPLGRFHAARWNQNPFEDRIGEWPPSPYRLLRALAARWFQYQRETGDDDKDLRDELLHTLAGELPSFRLPARIWRGQELRQYHPTKIKFTKKKDIPEVKVPQKTLTLDSYYTVPSAEPIYWIWPSCSLSPEAVQLLRQLLRRILYFGRAETWTMMRMVEHNAHIKPNCELKTTVSQASVPVLAHYPDQSLDIALLLASTDDKRLSNFRIPPGTKWFYAKIPVSPKQFTLPSPPVARPNLQVFRFALDSTVLPLVTETLPVAEAARRYLMGIHGRLTEKDGIRGRSTVFSGKDEGGKPLVDHAHACYLPTDDDGDGRLDHLTIFASGGFGPDERRALDRLRRLKTGRKGEDSHPLRLLLLGMGMLDEYHPGPLRESGEWVSATPYIASRYAKTEGRNRIDMGSPEVRAAFLQEDLRTIMAAVRPDIEPLISKIEPIWDENHAFRIAGRWRTIQFKRYRRKSGDDGGRRLAGAFRLTFSSSVPGPIVLGWSSHFGMGLFMPDF